MLNLYYIAWAAILYFNIRCYSSQQPAMPPFRQFVFTVDDYYHQEYVFAKHHTCISNPVCNVLAEYDIIIKSGKQTIYKHYVRQIPFHSQLYGIWLFTHEVRETNNGSSYVFNNLDVIELQVYDKIFRKIHYTIYTSFNGIAPNSYYKFFAGTRTSAHRLAFKMSLQCYGFTGKNCRFPCPTWDDSISCNYNTGEQTCRDGSRDIKNCLSKVNLCNSDTCLNGGKCIKYSIYSSRCMCADGYHGPNCNTTTCNPPCDSNHGTCTAPQTCSCKPGYTGKLCNIVTCEGYDKCKNGGVCHIRERTHFCMCDMSLHAGAYCEHTCTDVCSFGYCTYNGTVPKCECFFGYEGEYCDSIGTKPPPQFDTYYISPYKKRISYVVLTLSMIIVTCMMISLAVYLRHHKSRNISVRKKAEYVVQALTGVKTSIKHHNICVNDIETDKQMDINYG